MATARQMTANRENARKSTGPRTEEGKARSRQNARKHGLAGEGVVVPEDEAGLFERRLADWRPSLPGASTSPQHAWLAERLVAESIRFERAHEMELAVLGQIAHRAATSWDDDRRLAAEELAGRLASAPPLVRLQLRQTPQGCTLLAERWEALARIAEAGSAWDESHRREALDLLGRPPELRDSPLLVDGDDQDESPAACLALARREADTLRRRAEELGELDDHERAGAELGLAIERPDGFGHSGSGNLRRSLGLARRYLAAAWRRFRWAWDELDRATRDARRASPSDTPAPTPRPNPTARPRPRANEAAGLLGLLGAFSTAAEPTTDALVGPTRPETPRDSTPAAPADRPGLAGRPLGSWLSTGSGGGNRRQRRARASRAGGA